MSDPTETAPEAPEVSAFPTAEELGELPDGLHLSEAQAIAVAKPGDTVNVQNLTAAEAFALSRGLFNATLNGPRIEEDVAPPARPAVALATPRTRETVEAAPRSKSPAS